MISGSVHLNTIVQVPSVLVALAFKLPLELDLLLGAENPEPDASQKNGA